MKNTTTKIKELTEQISKATAILNDLTAQLEAEKNKATEKKEPSIEDRWKPEITDKYFPISSSSDVIDGCWWDGDSIDSQCYKNYNTWKSVGRAEEVFNKTKLLWLMEQIHDILCPDYKPDWRDNDEGELILFFNTMTDKWDSCCFNSVYATAFFDTIEHAEQACKILNDMGVKP